jgi:hypothetical protein
LYGHFREEKTSVCARSWTPGHQAHSLVTKSKQSHCFLMHSSHTLHWYWSWLLTTGDTLLDRVWNVMAHGQKPDFVFRRNGQVHFIFWRANVYSFVLMGTQHRKGVAYGVASRPTSRNTVTKASRQGVAT